MKSTSSNQMILISLLLVGLASIQTGHACIMTRQQAMSMLDDISRNFPDLIPRQNMPGPYGQQFNPNGQNQFNPYGQSQYGQGQYGMNPYGQGQGGQLPFGQNPYGQGQGQGQNGGQGPYGQNPYGQNPNQFGQNGQNGNFPSGQGGFPPVQSSPNNSPAQQGAANQPQGPK